VTVRERISRGVHTGPQIPGVQLFTPAGLKVIKELRPVSGVTAEHQVHQQGPARGLSAKHVDFSAELGLGPPAQQTGIFVRLFLDGRDGLIVAHRFRRLFRRTPNGVHCCLIERFGFDNGNLSRAHHDQILQEL
jgi:hypothetical protein